MRKQLVLIVLFVVFVSVGCTDLLSGRDNRFVGSWLLNEGDSIYMHSLTFLSDGTLTIADNYGYPGGGTWDIQDNRLVLTGVQGISLSYTYSFSDDGNSLTITNTNTRVEMTFIKQYSTVEEEDLSSYCITGLFNTQEDACSEACCLSPTFESIMPVSGMSDRLVMCTCEGGYSLCDMIEAKNGNWCLIGPESEDELYDKLRIEG